MNELTIVAVVIFLHYTIGNGQLCMIQITHIHLKNFGNLQIQYIFILEVKANNILMILSNGYIQLLIINLNIVKFRVHKERLWI